MLRLRPGASDFAAAHITGKNHKDIAVRAGDTAAGIDVAKPALSFGDALGVEAVGTALANESITVTTKISGIHGSVYLEVKRSGSLPMSSTSIGEVYLLVTTSQATVTVPVQMLMNFQATGCLSIPMGSGSRMNCSG